MISSSPSSSTRSASIFNTVKPATNPPGETTLPLISAVGLVAEKTIPSSSSFPDGRRAVPAAERRRRCRDEGAVGVGGSGVGGGGGVGRGESSAAMWGLAEALETSIGGRITGVVGISTRGVGRPGVGELALGVGGAVAGGAGKAPAGAGAEVETVDRGFGAGDFDGVVAVGAAVTGGVDRAAANAVGGVGSSGGWRRASLMGPRRDVRRSVPTSAPATSAAAANHQR
jgi:hypothetical protein